MKPKDRSDKGTTRAIRVEVADLPLRAKAERPRRSIRRLIKMMVRARAARPPCHLQCELSKSSVHRLLSAAPLSWRPARAEVQERRSFITELASDLYAARRRVHARRLLQPCDCSMQLPRGRVAATCSRYQRLDSSAQVFVRVRHA